MGGLLPCNHAVQRVVDLNIQKLHIEMDCLAVVRMMKDQAKNMSSAGQVVEEVKAMLRTRQDYGITWVRRSANAAAHGLAKWGVSCRAFEFWNQVPPDCIF